MNPTRKDLFAVLLIAVLSFAAYHNAFHGEFQYDDDRLIRFNFSLREPSLWQNILRFEPFRPLTLVTYAINYNISRKNPFSYHVVDFGLHLLATTLFYFFLRRISGNRLLCFFSAALFAVHPLNTESVSYIASRFVLLCAVFYWAALHSFDSHLRNPAWYKPVLFVLLFALAAASKEEAALIPFAALLYNFACHGLSSVKKHWLFHAVTISIVAAGVLFRVSHLYATQSNLPHPLGAYLTTQAFVWMKYLLLGFFPVPLNVDHFVSPLNLLHWKFLVSIAGIALILYSLWKWRANHSWIFFWGVWFFLNLAASSVIPLNDFMAEHRTYLSMFGFCACVAYTLHFSRSRSKLIPVALSFLLLFYVAGTIKRNQVWQKRISLWADAVQKSPQKYRPHINLAFVLYQLRVYEEALKEYTVARSLNPYLPLVHTGMGLTLMELERLQEAEASFRIALQLDPQFLDAKTGLGILHYRKRQYQQALHYFVQAYLYRLESRDLILMLCDSYLNLGRIDETTRILQDAARWEPRYATVHSLVQAGQNDAAVDELRRLAK